MDPFYLSRLAASYRAAFSPASPPWDYLSWAEREQWRERVREALETPAKGA